MTLTNPSYIRDVTVLDEDELKLARAFMQGAVYCWIKNRRDEAFAVRDLVGGENRDWNGTPLQARLRRTNSSTDASAASESYGRRSPACPH